jgi:hypothetical protein
MSPFEYWFVAELAYLARAVGAADVAVKQCAAEDNDFADVRAEPRFAELTSPRR